MEIREGKKLMRVEEREVGKKCGRRRDKEGRQEREGMGERNKALVIGSHDKKIEKCFSR